MFKLLRDKTFSLKIYKYNLRSFCCEWLRNDPEQKYNRNSYFIAGPYEFLMIW